jgi:hypothetical protein
MLPNDKLLGLLGHLATETTHDIREESPDADTEHCTFVGFSMGVQWALELAALDPDIARTLLLAIHESQQGDDPGMVREWNSNALKFIDYAAGHPPGR